MKKLAIAILVALSIAGCGKDTEEVPVETGPALLEDREIVFDYYGDETLTLSLKDDEGLLEVSDTSATIYYADQEVQLDYVEGNSLNDFPKAYYSGLQTATASNADYTSFESEDCYYSFIKTDNNNYVMATANKNLDYYCDQLLERIK